MSRFGSMLGGGTQGGGNGSASVRDFVKKNPDFMKMDASQRNKALMQFKSNAVREEAMRSGSNRGNFKLPGTSGEETELSASAQAIIEKMIAKQVKKNQTEMIAIKAGWFNGGRINKKGEIFDSYNRKVGEVNHKTKEVKIGFHTIGKYKQGHGFTQKMEKAVKALDPKNKPSGGIFGSMGGSTTSNSSWSFGSASGDDPMGGFYG